MSNNIEKINLSLTDDKFLIIKLLENSFEKFIKTLTINSSGEYRPNERDAKTIAGMSKDMKIMCIVFEKLQEGQCNPVKIYACQGEKIEKSNGLRILCHLIASTEKELEVRNICKQLFLDLKDDFTHGTYVTKETAVEIYDSFVNEYNARNKKAIVKAELKPDQSIDVDKTTAYPELLCIKCYNQEKITGRSIFARDRDRIIHSKAFRRLVDKAQIFTSQKGDHYRTRMTHTLEVTQIARSIAKRLYLNEELTEAIALAHDIGHTPFGHQGERTLNNILNGTMQNGIIPIIKGIDKNKSLRSGFKHNYQALRVLTGLELKYPKYQGLNLSYQIMEGVWKHTKIKNNGQLLYPIESFFAYPEVSYLHPEYSFSTNLEGQVVAIADEIAQRAHDLDDAFKSHNLVIEELERISHFRKSREAQIFIDKIKDDIHEAKEKHVIFVDEQDMFRARLCSEIITFFVNRVVEYSQDKIENYINDHEIKDYVFKEKLIYWDENTENISNSLQTLVNKKVINSSEVAQFDTTAEHTILKLFEYYYLHPLTLSDNTLKRIYLEFLKIDGAAVIDFRSGDVNLVRKEFDKITIEDLEDKEYKEEYYKKRKILAQCIADHIGGMTDSFAIQEYHKLYHL